MSSRSGAHPAGERVSRQDDAKVSPLPTRISRACLLCAGLSCESTTLSYIFEVPPELDWMGAIPRDRTGAPLGPSTLQPTSDPARIELTEVEGLASVFVFGYDELDLEQDDARVIRASRVRLATEQDPLLLAPRFAASGDLSGRLELIEPPRLTADWLTSCPTEACDLFPLDGGRAVAGTTTVTFNRVMPLSEREVLAISPKGEVHRATSKGSELLSRVAHDGAPATGVLGSDGMMYFAHLGAILRGPPEGPFEAIMTLFGEPEVELASSPLNHPFEVYFATNDGQIGRIVDEHAELLYQVKLEQKNLFSMAWLEQGRVGVTFYEASTLVLIEGGQIRELTAANPRSMALVPGVGILVGSQNGNVLLVDEHRTQHLATLGDQPVYEMFPRGSGVLFGGLRGFLGFYQPGIGICDLRSIAGHNIRDLAFLGDGAFIASDATTGTSGLAFAPVIGTSVPAHRCYR
ncbi:MAG: hypothetical protein HYV07_33305 [Deltaproteobacteria bacterium]|nr:hypothetical protein [Deltaproteobacteria bacterium]